MSGWVRLVELGLAGEHVSLAPYTTYKLGGPARYLLELRAEPDLAHALEAYRAEPLPILVIGRGSNLVVADSGFPGVVIHLSGAYARIETEPEVVAGGGTALPQLARAAVRAGRLGLEFLVGIPGSVGGAIRQNAGCFDREMSQVLDRARILDLATATLSEPGPSELELGYRRSNLGTTSLVLSVRFHTRRGDRVEGEGRMREITRWRKENQPGGSYNAGSVFKNPPGDAAGRIIDSLGLKGMRVGGAAVSDRHANFFVTMPGATALDVYRLVTAVADRVHAQSGVRLEPEIQFVGDFGQ